jgi:peptide/nickel transport system substrate-binding protein
MSKSKGQKKVPAKVSMKEAFDTISTKVAKKKTGQNGSKKTNPIREFFWNYPDHLARIWKLTSPLSTILLFSVIGFALFSFLRSDTFAEKVSSREYNYFVEGRVGAISTFNPLFSNQNDVDKAIQELVFEKFLYVDSTGEVLPGIATKWDITNDGKVYTFDIVLDHVWSDGTSLTMDDVYFTFNTAIVLSKDQGYDTVASGLIDVEIEIVDEDTIKFVLPETNSVFPELASIYIVPKHILEDVSLYEMPFDRFSRNPVGSGPYWIYRSEPNIVYLQSSEHYQPTPNISNIVVRVYSDIEKLESAFRNGLLDAVLLPNNDTADFVDEYATFDSHKLDLPYRQRSLFFNLRKEKLQNESLRKGLSMLIDKESLLEDSGVRGELSSGPIYQNSWAFAKDIDYPTYNPEEAEKLLKDAGYTKNESNGYFETEEDKLLTLTISFLDNDVNQRMLNTLSTLLKDEGIIINLEPLTYSQLTQEILATRNFEVLMYEIELTVDPDQYNLWHSLQKDYPNLNLSGYEFSRVDIILEEARRESSKSERKESYALFQKYLMADTPAIFLYRPSYLYVVRDAITGLEYDGIVRLEDIYRNICTWEFRK